MRSYINKYIAFALICTFLFTVVPFSAIAQDYSLFAEEFNEDVACANLDIDTNDGNGWANLTKANSGTYPKIEGGYARFKSDANSICQANYWFPEQIENSVQMEFKLKLSEDATTGEGSVFVMGNANRGATIMRLTFGIGSTFGVLYGKAGASNNQGRMTLGPVIETGSEYTFLLAVDFVDNLFDIQMIDESGETYTLVDLPFFRLQTPTSLSSMYVTANQGFDGEVMLDSIKIIKSVPDEQAVLSASEALTIGDTAAVTADFKLPTQGLFDTQISWTSDDQSIIEVESSAVSGECWAKVVRPIDVDKTIILTAEINKGEATTSKHFTVVVPKDYTDADRVMIDAQNLTLGDTTAVTQNIDLPISGANGSFVSWESSDESVVAIEETVSSARAVVYRPDNSSKSKNVILTAVVTLNDARTTKQFSLRVLRIPTAVIKDDFTKEDSFILNDTNGYRSITYVDGYPKLENRSDKNFTELVFKANEQSKCEVYRYFPAVTGLVTVETELACVGESTTAVLHNIMDSANATLVRFIIQSGNINVQYGSGTGSTNVTKTVVPGYTHGKTYKISTTFNLSTKRFSLSVDDGQAIIKDVPFYQNGSSEDVQRMVFCASQNTSTELYVKSFNVYTTESEMADEEAVSSDAEAVDIGELTAITADLTLPLSGPNDTIFRWDTDLAKEYITINEGTAYVTRPFEEDGDVVGHLFLTAERGISSYVRDFDVTIKYISNAEAVDVAAEKLTIGDISNVSSDLTLPLTGAYGTTVTWSSSNPDVLCEKGILNKSAVKNTTNVTLTASIQRADKVTEKRFTVTVVGSKDGGTSGGGTGSKGSSGRTTKSIVVADSQLVTSPKSEYFQDLSGFEWAEEYITSYAQKGIISGTGNGYYEPSRNVNREEFAAMLVKASGLFDEKAECNFLDVAPDSWYYRYVASAANAGIVNGVGDQKFGSGQYVNRQDAALMVNRTLMACGLVSVKKVDITPFADDDEIGDYAKEAVYELLAAQAINGIDEGVFGPNEPLNRAQMAKMVFLAMNSAEEVSELQNESPVAVPETSAGAQDEKANSPALALYNSVSERQNRWMENYFKTPVVALDTGAWANSAYAITALWKNEDLERANNYLVELCTKWPVKTESSSTMADSYFSVNIMLRCWYMFGDQSSIYPGRLSSAAQQAIEKYLWDYIYNFSTIELASMIDEDFVYIDESENHDLVRRATYIIGSQILLKTAAYKDKTLLDGHKLSEHNVAWTNNMKHYIRTKAKAGVFVERLSTGYAKYSIDSLLSIYDFVEDAELKGLTGKFLDFYFTDVLMQTSDGVPAGAKSRVYKDSNSINPRSDAAASYLHVMFGKYDHWNSRSPHPAVISICLTDYRPPYVLYDFAQNPEARGNYTYVSQNLGAGNRQTVGNERVYFCEVPGKVLNTTYITPDYGMGAVAIDRNLEYTDISRQNKWVGVIFSGPLRDPNHDSRIYVTCEGTMGNGLTSYHDTNSIAVSGAMLVTRIPEAEAANDLQIYVSEDLYSTVVKQDGWLFMYDPDGTSYVGIKPSMGGFSTVLEADGGRWLTFTEQNVPVVIQCGATSDYESLEKFMDAVKSNIFTWTNKNEFSYQNCEGDAITMYTDFQMPKINCEPISLTPDYLIKSPYVNSVYGSGIIDIVNTKGEKHTINFNE